MLSIDTVERSDFFGNEPGEEEASVDLLDRVILLSRLEDSLLIDSAEAGLRHLADSFRLEMVATMSPSDPHFGRLGDLLGRSPPEFESGMLPSE